MTATPPQVGWAQADARRIHRQFLDEPTDAPPAAVAAAMLGAHAQVLSAAELSLALRTADATRAEVRAALREDRTLVKTYGPRGTVHLLPAGDLPLWTGALSAVPWTRALPDGLRLTEAQTEEVIAAIGDALTGTELTVDELTDAIVARTGPWAGERVMEAFQDKWPRWRQVTHLAGWRGVLAFGADRGRKVTYTNPGARPMEGTKALRALVERYLYAYGPATPKHFARWLAAPAGWAGELFAAAAGEGRIEEVSFEGEAAWVVAGDTEFPDAPARGVRLLPYFDAFSIASQPRERLFPGKAYERALAGGQAGNYPVLLVDGVVAGVWHQRRSGKRIAVTVEPLKRLSATRVRELEAQAARVGAILEGTAELTVGRVEVGPHA
ncbi:winged helix DNA-binding domain-containing protein [Streptomyces sp. NBC_01353]|uniref:winged helix DNA-binding domain-containing protein n=1 Tax=Streptomyces sp. NBC_01353 TaxID=2903835 RepID=UPI002E30E139|nr:winged helix DNA-binding domain-containing protein [Streptomyces sp. NBC_01353]